ncbi:class I SAM-dependent methyltransferase [Pseudonocardia sp. GCM10023141]|uniref:class I SAM-dependent methyltransferase n=1 Tax=Pseudonocardia sp. GCM10023141 TaxID=3252653 RepID=UPI003623275B
MEARAQRESDLVTYYDNEVRARLERDLPVERVARRTDYLDLLEREERRSVLEVGSGPGRDAAAFVTAGLTYTGVDLAPGSVAVCRSLGFDVHVASVLELPFASAAFDAGWTMSTLLHVADDDLDTALAEIARVLRPGSPLAIGLWGDRQGSESRWGERPEFGPPRFFSIRTDDGLRDALQRHGTLEQWATWPGADDRLHYQWAVLRID